jgi:hypothetical protein
MWRYDFADLAHYQDEAGALIDWPALRAGSGDAVAFKVSQRNNYIDPTAERHRAMAHQVGFGHVGLYHWQSPTSEASISSQVANWARGIGGSIQRGEYFMGDCEQVGITEAETWEMVNLVETHFTHRPSALYFGIYTAGGTLARSMRLRRSDFGPRAIHIAAYTTEARLGQLLAARGLLDLPISFNQFGSSGILPNGQHLPGVTGRGDMNQCNDWEILDRICGLDRAVPVPTQGAIHMDVVCNASDWDSGAAGNVKFALQYAGQALYHLSPVEWEAGGSLPGTPMSNEQLDALAAIPVANTINYAVLAANVAPLLPPPATNTVDQVARTAATAVGQEVAGIRDSLSAAALALGKVQV